MTEQTPTKPDLQVDIVSDVMCPWCYIGKRRLEKALGHCADLDIDIRWHPYQLDPTLPPEGRDRKLYLETKFGGPDRAKAIYANIEQAGKAEGIPFDFRAIKVSPNTIDAHRVIRWSTNANAQDAVVEALFSAYFLEGRNIGDHDVLVDVARTNGMDETLVRTLLEKQADVNLIEEEIALAQSLGIDGVPCFILANSYAIAGAQDPQILANAMRKAADAGQTGQASTFE